MTGGVPAKPIRKRFSEDTIAGTKGVRLALEINRGRTWTVAASLFSPIADRLRNLNDN